MALPLKQDVLNHFDSLPANTGLKFKDLALALSVDTEDDKNKLLVALTVLVCERQVTEYEDKKLEAFLYKRL